MIVVITEVVHDDDRNGYRAIMSAKDLGFNIIVIKPKGDHRSFVEFPRNLPEMTAGRAYAYSVVLGYAAVVAKNLNHGARPGEDAFEWPISNIVYPGDVT